MVHPPPPGEGHSSSCSVGREDNAGSAVTRRGGGGVDDVREEGGRGEGGAGASAPAPMRLVSASVLPPPRWKPHLPAPSSPAAGLLATSPRAPRLSVLAASVGVGATKVSVRDGGMDPGSDR